MFCFIVIKINLRTGLSDQTEDDCPETTQSKWLEEARNK